MKLRIHKDSIRFRFTSGEVETLASGQALEETVAVGPLAHQAFVYCVAPDLRASESPRIGAEFGVNRLIVSVPLPLIQAWRESEQLSLEGEQNWAGGKVRILLEKDLQRLNPKEGEETAGVYPNPRFGKVRCDHP
jgi:hypothetical protein